MRIEEKSLPPYKLQINHLKEPQKYKKPGLTSWETSLF
ncbi:hypothetical protein M089_1802 [Bacteroides ovatus str. 3725 D9 iii]|nr:hypothetical protein M088_3272 [Bacteroides ovatus str. 3725 D1 iv]KDS17914.1 hypothetical protein M082_3738 [Bacteroides fragilis str. 3725 D9 ii]KDS43551.1 hypothetical protein M089_1802 [Bacteroides ovatus str. 3725 D9 iii]